MTGAIVALLIFFIFFVSAANVVCTIYMYRLYEEFPEPRSWFMRALLQTALIKSIVGIYFAYIAAARLADSVHAFAFSLPLLPADLGLLAFGAAVIILLSPPIYYAVLIWRLRR